MGDHAAPTELVTIPAAGVELAGDLIAPPDAAGLVIFAHGSGSSRHSPRNRFVAGILNEAGLATLLFDLLTEAEEIAEARTRHLRFDIELLSARLIATVEWMAQRDEATARLPIGLFGASTGAAAALVASARRGDLIRAVVSRGGRPDLAGDALPKVRAPTLLIVGERDQQVLALNEQAAGRMTVTKRIAIVPGATHLFEESGALEEAADLARTWFVEHLTLAGTDAP